MTTTRLSVALTLALALGYAAPASAVCPSGVTIEEELYCSSTIDTSVDHTAPSLLGGSCDSELCYSCGEPYANQAQVAPEAVYTFVCQVSGTVSLLITNLPCDLDIYVLDNTCDPYYGCLIGSTAPFAVDDQVDFDCIAGQTHYIVVEAYGTAHLDKASGPCTNPDGTVYSPDYTLSFDVSASTGCNEDCDDGEDNDIDGDVDCADDDCEAEDVCCDLDGDDFFSMECLGLDCDDSDPSVFPGAAEVENGIDDDCDGYVDEGTDSYDDDGDGWSEDDGDCDDGSAAVFPGAPEDCENGIDDDCDGLVDAADDDCDEPVDDDDTTEPPVDDDDTTEPPADDDDAAFDPPDDDDIVAETPDTFGCDCDCDSDVAGLHASPGLSLMLAMSLGVAAVRRRR